MSTISEASTSRAGRARLDHPVIDSDGHILEFMPVFLDYLERIGGSALLERWKARRRGPGVFPTRRGIAERRDTKDPRGAWWAFPAANTLDRVTAALPSLLYERMDDIGIDYAVLFPTQSLGIPAVFEDELRVVGCRAFNTFAAEVYGEYADRFTMAALIPMNTPEEAIAELEHAASLGLKVALIPAYVRRPIPSFEREHPEMLQEIMQLDAQGGQRVDLMWLDAYGVESAYDYDPVWAKVAELKMPVVTHSHGIGFSDRRAVSNYVFNHMNMFGVASELLCKSLFLGGVTRRFPTVKFGFLEGGAAWPVRLFNDLIGHWEKRNLRALEAQLNPNLIDRELALDLFARYGGKLVEGKMDLVIPHLIAGADVDENERDEFEACGIERAEDIRDLFVPNFFFGCEADDPMNALAFNPRMVPFESRLQVVLGSDIGHWDVPDMNEVMEEAYEPVEHGLIGGTDYRDLVCDNAVRLFGGANPNFFAGTKVERYAADFLKSTVTSTGTL